MNKNESVHRDEVMHKKDIIWCAVILAVIILAFILVPYIKRVTTVISVSREVICTAHDYYERDDLGYLTIDMSLIYDGSRQNITSTFIVENEFLKQQLSEIDLGKISRAFITFKIPYTAAKKNDIVNESGNYLKKGVDMIKLKQSTDKYDSYFRIERITVQY